MICKKPWIVPIPGTTKAERIKENAGAADVLLTQEEIAKIDAQLDIMDLKLGVTKIYQVEEAVKTADIVLTTE